MATPTLGDLRSWPEVMLKNYLYVCTVGEDWTQVALAAAVLDQRQRKAN